MQIVGGVRIDARAYLKASGAGLLHLGGVVCILIGYWAPWVGHPAAGLVQNAFDLSEFVKFLPQVKSGSEPVLRWLFFLPLSTVALSLSIWATTEGRLCSSSLGTRWLRLPLVGVGLLLLIILIPPYPYTPDRLLGGEFRERTILALVSWVAFLLTLVGVGGWLTRRWGAVLLALLGLIGAVGPLVQYLSLHDALSALYGRPVAIGWGVWLTVAGMLVVLAGTALGFRPPHAEIAAGGDGRVGGNPAR
jgi:hypothetical protein